MVMKNNLKDNIMNCYDILVRWEQKWVVKFPQEVITWDTFTVYGFQNYLFSTFAKLCEVNTRKPALQKNQFLFHYKLIKEPKGINMQEFLVPTSPIFCTMS